MEASVPRRIIVTGSRGVIGAALTEHLSCRHDVVELDLALGHDLTDEEFVRSWFKRERADALVNLFAINDHVSECDERADLFNVTLRSFERYLSTNLTALFSVCREFARNNDGGSIVNFASTYGVVSPVPSLYRDGEKHIGYSVSKAGVIQLTRHLAVHLAPRMRVNCLVPGGVEQGQDGEFIRRYAERVPMRRMMKASELSGIVEYLISPQSSYTTGAVLPVDGGWTAW